ncbi:MAG: ferredoxin [Candidatus Nanopelagicales bacterium]|nr:ferredoxin [Candidatus Nanopelagicales bacterium]
MVKITIDMGACQNYAQCVAEAEDIFSLDDNGKIQYVAEVSDDRLADVENAMDVCPMQAISIEVS